MTRSRTKTFQSKKVFHILCVTIYLSILSFVHSFPPPLKRTTIQRRHGFIDLLSSTSSFDTRPEDYEDDWQAGNVYEDLEKLENAIRIANGEQLYQHRLRIQTLNNMARQRRPLIQDFQRYFLLPTLLSILLSRILPSPVLNVLSRISSLHFAILVITFPLFLLVYLSRKKNHTSYLPSSDLKNVDPEYFKFVTDGKDLLEDVFPRNAPQSILEMWASTVIGSAPLALTILPTRVRLVTRLAVALSWHQYPAWWHSLYCPMLSPQPWTAAVAYTRNAIALSATAFWCVIDGAICLAEPSLPSFSRSRIHPVFTALMWIGPMIQIVAALRGLRVDRMHDQPIHRIQPSHHKEIRLPLTWRYRQTWRKPERVTNTIRRWWRGMWYWWFFAGSVQEQVQREYGRGRGRHRSLAYQRGLTVWQRVQQEVSPTPDRAQWKARAMQKIAEQHEQSYRKGNFDVRIYFQIYMQLFKILTLLCYVGLC